MLQNSFLLRYLFYKSIGMHYNSYSALEAPPHSAYADTMVGVKLRFQCIIVVQRCLTSGLLHLRMTCCYAIKYKCRAPGSRMPLKCPNSTERA